MGRKVATVALGLVLCVTGAVHASGYYEWTDDSGVTHYADTLDQVPAQYRSRCKVPKQEPAAVAAKPAIAAPAGSAAEVEAGTPGRFEVAYQLEGATKRIIIPVRLNDSVVAPMALDTGSPGMVVFLELAMKLGLFSHDNGTLFVAAGGVGGVVPAIRTIVDSVSVLGARSAFVPTTVTDNFSNSFEGLIGMDFLAGYKLTVDSQRQVVVFETIAPDPNTYGGHDEAWWRKTFEQFRTASDRWRAFGVAIDRGDRPARYKPLATFQTREAERLLQRLHAYASDNAVPQHWR
jgi:hypothetical protein